MVTEWKKGYWKYIAFCAMVKEPIVKVLANDSLWCIALINIAFEDYDAILIIFYGMYDLIFGKNMLWSSWTEAYLWLSRHTLQAQNSEIKNLIFLNGICSRFMCLLKIQVAKYMEHFLESGTRRCVTHMEPRQIKCGYFW